MKQKNFEKGIEDCNTSIELNEKYFKSYLRRSEARKELG
jgi:DnaJ family protein C protein 7